jgi:hypothetical protein
MRLLALAIAVLVGLLIEAAITFPGLPRRTPDYRPHQIDVRGGALVGGFVITGPLPVWAPFSSANSITPGSSSLTVPARPRVLACLTPAAGFELGNA